MKWIKRILLTLLIIIFILIVIFFIIGYSTYSKALKEKPLLDRVSDVTDKPNFVKFSDMSQDYRNAVIAVEDHRFYDHGPIDIIAICTITQQVAKNIVFSQEQSISRKLGEIFAAFDLEKNYTKAEIFELYVNTAYFGEGYYGIYEASMGYYNKEPKDLSLDEASMLARSS